MCLPLANGGLPFFDTFISLNHQSTYENDQGKNGCCCCYCSVHRDGRPVKETPLFCMRYLMSRTYNGCSKVGAYQRNRLAARFRGANRDTVEIGTYHWNCHYPVPSSTLILKLSMYPSVHQCITLASLPPIYPGALKTVYININTLYIVNNISWSWMQFTGGFHF